MQKKYGDFETFIMQAKCQLNAQKKEHDEHSDVQKL